MNPARLDKRLGDADAAIARYARVFEIAKFAGEDDHPGLALVHWARAEAYRTQGLGAEALEDMRAAHQLRAKAFGACEPRTLTAREHWISLPDELSAAPPTFDDDC